MASMGYDLNEIVKKAKNGDCDAFSNLYENYAADLYRFAFFMLGNREDAQDAVQDAALQAYTHIAALKKEAAFKSWFFKILSNCCKTKLIQAARSGRVLPFEDLSDLAPDEGAAKFPSSLELRDAIYGLSKEERNIVLLSVVGGYKSHEISKMLDMPSGTVRSKLARSLKKLEPMVLDSPIGAEAIKQNN